MICKEPYYLRLTENSNTIPKGTQATGKIRLCLGRTKLKLNNVLKNDDTNKTSSQINSIAGNTITVKNGGVFEVGMEVTTPGIKGTYIQSVEENSVTISATDSHIMPSQGQTLTAIKSMVSSKEKARVFSEEVYMDATGISTDSNKTRKKTNSSGSEVSSDDEESSEDEYDSTEFTVRKKNNLIIFYGTLNSGETFKLAYEEVRETSPEDNTCVSTLMQSSCRGTLTRFNTGDSRVLVAEASEFGTGNSFSGWIRSFCFNQHKVGPNINSGSGEYCAPATNLGSASER